MLNLELHKISLFEGLDLAGLKRVEALAEQCTFSQDEVIFEQGQPAIYLYIVLRGEVVVNFKPYDGPALTVAHILPGGVFGWSSALRRETYTSAAIATQDCEAVRLRGDRLFRLCQQHPTIGVVVLDRLADVIAERLRSTHDQILSILTEGMTISKEWRRRIANHD
jgi:CRP/FNR family cyclic AMP-dependent transcriptional regulator